MKAKKKVLRERNLSAGKASVPPAAPVGRWSAQPQSSIKRQFEMEARIKKLAQNIAWEEKKKAAAEANRKRQAGLVDGGQGLYRAALMGSLNDIEECSKLISAYQGDIEGLRAEIAAMQPTSSQAAERAAKQEKFAAIAKDCQGEILSLDVQVAGVKARLESILSLKQKMRELAVEIDLSNAGGFGAEPFKALASSLPGPLGPAALAWLDWMLGNELKRACIIKSEIEKLPETLASANVFRRGDTAQLNAKDYTVATFEPPHIPSAFEVEAEAQRQAEANREKQFFRVGDPAIRLPGSGF